MIYLQSHTSVIESRTNAWYIVTADWTAELDPLLLVVKVLVDASLSSDVSFFREGAIYIIVGDCI